MRLTMFCLLILCSSWLFSQRNDFIPDPVNIVRVELKNGTEGSGFIIGAHKDSVYILTAGHVIETRDRNDPDFISVQVESKKFIAYVVFSADSHARDSDDLAVLRIFRPGMKIKPCPIVADASECDGFYFIRSAGKTRLPLAGRPDGKFDFWLDRDMNRFQVFLEEIESGDSGSALFSREGLAGIIIEKESATGTILSIMRIHALISEKLPAECQFRIIDN